MFRSLNKQTRLYLFIFLFTIFSGAIRKWVVNSDLASNVFLLIQMVLPFLFFLNKEAFKVFSNQSFLGLYLALLIVQALNPLNQTIFHGIFGIILHSVFWVSIFYYIENREKFEVEKILIIVIIACAGELALAFIQYDLPPDHILNKYVDSKYVGDAALVGNNVRVTGTFSYIAGFTSFLIFHALLIWRLVKQQYASMITVFLLLFGFVGALMSGSRGGVYTFLLIVVYVLFFVASRKMLANYLPKLLPALVIIIAVLLLRGGAGIEDKIANAFGNFEERRSGLSERGEEKQRALGDLYTLTNFRGEYPLFGIGLGATYQGTAVLFGTSKELNDYGFIESENEKVVLEGGFILLLFKLILVVTLCRQLYIPKLGKFIIAALLIASPPMYNISTTIFEFLGIAMVDNFYYREYWQTIAFLKQKESSTTEVT